MSAAVSEDPYVLKVRREISDLDSSLVALVNKRLKLVAQLKRYKEEHGIGFVDLQREEWMLQYLQRANGGPGAAAGAELQNLAEQNEGDDCGSGFEVNCRPAAHLAKRRWKDSGNNRRNEAVEIGHAGAHGNQREHIRGSVHHRRPAPLKERPTTPQHHGSCQQ